MAGFNRACETVESTFILLFYTHLNTIETLHDMTCSAGTSLLSFFAGSIQLQRHRETPGFDAWHEWIYVFVVAGLCRKTLV